MIDGILATIGRTPLVALRRVMPRARFRLYAKLEALNPGGSIKDRAALSLLEAAWRDGALTPDTVVVESSSGNMGIGLAQACAYLGLRFVCVVDARTTAQNVAIMRAYGAEIEVVDTPDPDGGYLGPRLARVRALVAAVPSGFWPNQYANLNNARAHRQTMREIADALDGTVDWLFCPTSTCGTLRGCADYVRERGLRTRIVAVDAVGSVIFGAARGVGPGSVRTRRLIPGHGAAIRPALYRDGLAGECVHVTDAECIVGCRRLVAREGILAGGSSGAAMMAVERLRERLGEGTTCVAIFPDRGERYLDTIYSEAWVAQHFGALDAVASRAGEEDERGREPSERGPDDAAVGVA
jgi:cysteine synthase A